MLLAGEDGATVKTVVSREGWDGKMYHDFVATVGDQSVLFRRQNWAH